MADLLVVKCLFAFSPIAVVLLLMVGFKWAGAAGWFITFIVSVALFGANARLLAFAQVKGGLFFLYVLYIVWMALVLYHMVNESGAIQNIGSVIRRLTEDKPMQLLILGWNRLKTLEQGG